MANLTIKNVPEKLHRRQAQHPLGVEAIAAAPTVTVSAS